VREREREKDREDKSSIKGTEMNTFGIHLLYRLIIRKTSTILLLKKIEKN
jgi:hypothetical protein